MHLSVATINLYVGVLGRRSGQLHGHFRPSNRRAEAARRARHFPVPAEGRQFPSPAGARRLRSGEKRDKKKRHSYSIILGCGWCVMLCCVPCANLPCAVCRVPCAVCCIWLLTQSRLLSPLLRPFRPPRHCTDAVRGDHERPIHTDPCVTEKHETRFFVQVKRRGGKGGGGGDTRRRLLRRVRAAVTVS